MTPLEYQRAVIDAGGTQYLLSDLMREHELKTVEVAELLDVIPRTVSRWKNGRVEMPYAYYALLKIIVEK